jgi:hypothetical protein
VESGGVRLGREHHTEQYVHLRDERQTLTPIPMGGVYSGGIGAPDQGCTDPADDGPVELPATITVTQSPAGTQLMFDILGFATCIVSSTSAVTRRGPLHSFSGTFDCGGGPNAATVYELRATSLGMEGRWKSAAAAGGCREEARFSGVVIY